MSAVRVQSKRQNRTLQTITSKSISQGRLNKMIQRYMNRGGGSRGLDVYLLRHRVLHAATVPMMRLGRVIRLVRHHLGMGMGVAMALLLRVRGLYH